MVEDRILREGLEAARADGPRRLSIAENGSVAILARTTAESHYPTAAATYYVCTPLQIDGPEIEGAAATFVSEGGRRIIALNVGKSVPPEGTKIIAHACGGRWTFRYDD